MARHSLHGGTRALAQLMALLCLWTMASLVHAANYNFSGGNIAGCTRSGSVYTCASLPMSEWNDSMTIGDGITVNVDGNVGFGYNQTLKMSGSARLTSKGSLNIADIAPSNLQISGGFLVAAGAFNVGNQSQTLTADITGGSLYIGNGSALTINGTLKSTGVVNLGSHTVINGPVSGSAIYTNSPVKITGNVVAGTEFDLASGSSVTGNITAPVVRIRASSVVVTGNVTASTALTLESGNKIVGDVSTGTLTLNDSAAMVQGNAVVDKAVLGWAGRVTQFITCRTGDTAGNCSCVVNNSGYAVNTADGPRCKAATVAPSAPHHFEIWHDGNGLTCAPDPVTVRACANASCSSLHTAGATATLTPGGASVTVDADGSADGSVASSVAGSALLSAGSGTVCKTRSGAASTCDFTFALSGLDVDLGLAHRAESNERTLTLTAIKAGAKDNKCGAAFTGQKAVQLSCQYLDPGDGTLPVRVAGFALNQSGSATSKCDGAGRTLNVTFDNEGKAGLLYRYADVGKIQVTATIASPSMTGQDDVVITPASFTIVPSGPYVAGVPFNAAISAYNLAGNKTPNFGQESTPAAMAFTSRLCAPSGGQNPAPIVGQHSFANGALNVQLRWAEVGQIYLDTELAGGKYLGVSEDAEGSMLAKLQCADSAGAFTAASLRVTEDSERSFYYSGQPIALTVQALSSLGTALQNYHGSFARAISLKPLTSAKAAIAAQFGTLAPATIAAAQFTTSGAAVTPAFTFANPRTAPTTVVVRAEETLATTVNSSANSPEMDAPIRSGRLRLFGVFGRAGASLRVPYRAEYWTGASWLVNALDNTGFGAGAVALSPQIGRMDGTVVAAVSPMAGGQGSIMLTPPARGTSTGVGIVDLAVNLGMSGPDVSCLASHPAGTTAARMPWLRSANGNCGAQSDPSARVHFGMTQPEHRRVIHVREVFR